MKNREKIWDFTGKVADWILGLIYPVRCPFCDEPVPYGQGKICKDCRAALPVVRDPYCMKCGKQLKGWEKEYCRDCLLHTHYFDRGRILLVYKGNVKQSIYRFKYRGRKEYAGAYAGLFDEELGEFIREIKPDALIPVPLHRHRLRRRSYNQAQLLAEKIGRRMGVPVYCNLVSRMKNTIPQKELDLAQRQNNLKKAFKINRNDVKLNTIIIIDDIYTTGSTVDEISRLFRKQNVAHIFFLTLAGGE